MKKIGHKFPKNKDPIGIIGTIMLFSEVLGEMGKTMEEMLSVIENLDRKIKKLEVRVCQEMKRMK